MMLKCRLDRNTYRRVFAGATYLENQVNHVHVVLHGHEKIFADSICHEQYTPVSDGDIEIAQRLHDLWMVVWDGELDHDFRYNTKRDTERRFMDVDEDNTEGIPQPWLRRLEIIVTTKCNERCIHCYIPNAEKDEAVTFDKEAVKETVRQFRAMNGLKVNFSGGEPLLHPDIWELLDFCQQQNLMLLLNSNMVVLTPKMVKRLETLRMFNIQVSLYSMQPEIHDKITGRKGAFEHTRRSIEMLVNHNIPVMISCPVMKANCHCVADIKRYADSLNIDCYFDYVMMARSDRTSDNLDGRITISETKSVIRQIVEASPMSMSAISNATSCEELMKKEFAHRWNRCDIMSSSLCMDADGTLFPCPGWNRMKLANIKDTTLSEVWTKSTIANNLRIINQRQFTKCSSCNLHHFCDMCIVYNDNENGSVSEVCNQFCIAAKMLKEVVKDIYDEMKHSKIHNR